MESKKIFGKQMERILAGHGFYIVMVLCAAIIGVSIWSLFRTPVKPVPDEPEFDEMLSDVPPIMYATEESYPPEETSEQVSDEANSQETVSEVKAVWPLEGEIQREYSMDALQYDLTMADWRTHDGVDISAEIGTKVFSVRSGTVQKVYSDDMYGTSVVIDHGNGLVICYSNLEQIPTVYEGDSLSAGDVIGSVGDTAKCESMQSSHLHLSASLDGKSISPLEYLPKKT